MVDIIFIIGLGRPLCPHSCHHTRFIIDGGGRCDGEGLRSSSPDPPSEKDRWRELWLWVGMEPMDTSNFSEKREARAELGFHLQWQQAGQALILSERVSPLPTHSIALLLDSSLEKLAFFGASSSPFPLTP